MPRKGRKRQPAIFIAGQFVVIPFLFRHKEHGGSSFQEKSSGTLDPSVFNTILLLYANVNNFLFIF